MTTSSKPKPLVDKELIKAKAREQVASRKLDRLKERYDKLKVLTETQLQKQSGEREKLEQSLHESLALNEELSLRCKSLQDEASMWKAQLFEQLDRLDHKHDEFLSLQTELSQAQWQMVELVNHERTLCETERAKSEAQVDSLQKELTAARARVDGLKNMGTCLAAKLDRATAQRDVLQREHARLVEQGETQELLLESKDEEITELRNQLFEARGQLLTQRLASDNWSSLKEGLDHQTPAPEPFLEPEEPQHPVAVSQESNDIAHTISETLLAANSQGRRQLRLASSSRLQPVVLASPFKWFSHAKNTVSGWLKVR